MFPVALLTEGEGCVHLTRKGGDKGSETEDRDLVLNLLFLLLLLLFTLFDSNDSYTYTGLWTVISPPM